VAGRVVVTGAFSFTGAAVARDLRRRGTNDVERHFGARARRPILSP
jgi:hypothetical protein